MNEHPSQNKQHEGNRQGLIPLIFFFVLYLFSSLVLGDFYALPISLAFLLTAIVAVALTRGIGMEERIAIFSRGASDPNILYMIWIFVLAGAFSAGTKYIGAVDAVVNLTLYLIPPSLVLPGLFISACLVSISIGTSVGTVVALVPIATALSESLGISTAFVVAVVAGGSFFGDNLSFISDTTIAATRTQGVAMQSKFRENLRIALPAALLALLLYGLMPIQTSNQQITAMPSIWLIIPYIVVLTTAIGGLSVMPVLLLGIGSSALVGLPHQGIELWSWIKALGEGINGMGELIVLTLIAGGVLELIRYNGGMDYLISRLSELIRGRRGAEGVISLLVVLTNACTANNTIAILTVGTMSREVSEQYGIRPERTASLLDTMSCVAQGLLPYGAQLLLAAQLSGLTPLQIVGYMYYPMILGLFALISIAIQRHKSTSKSQYIKPS